MSEDLAIEIADIFREEHETADKRARERIEKLLPTQPGKGVKPLDIGGGFIPLPPKKETRITLDGVKWLLKGGIPAKPSDAFAYAFATDKNGAPNEYWEIVEFLRESGPVKVDGYTYSLSKNGNFIQRNLEVQGSCSSSAKRQ